MAVTTLLRVSALLLSWPLPSTSARTRSGEHTLATSPDSVCCCTDTGIKASAADQCRGIARNGAQRYWYHAATPNINPEEAPASNACHARNLCCHTYENRCPFMSHEFSNVGRYIIKNVDAKLCMPLPEVAEPLFNATPQEIFSNTNDGSKEFRPAFLGALGRDSEAEGLMPRDFIILVDKSSSMLTWDAIKTKPSTKGKLQRKVVDRDSRWKQAEKAIEILAPRIVEKNSRGASVIFFDEWSANKTESVKTAEEVKECFAKIPFFPFETRSSYGYYRSKLLLILKEAMELDIIGRAKSILVLTDGKAADMRAISDAIDAASKEICRPEQLSISFIQVGSDVKASEYLQSLGSLANPSGLVDTMTVYEMHGKSFLEIVEEFIAE